jgi:large subunit ribosomal protein L18
MATQSKIALRQSRRNRIRSRVVGTDVRPRLCVFRSNRAISAQLIDDTKGHTIAAVTTRTSSGASMTAKATAVGRTIAQVAKKAGIEKAVFDRGGFIYTGLVRAVADGARAEGLAL